MKNRIKIVNSHGALIAVASTMEAAINLLKRSPSLRIVKTDENRQKQTKINGN